MARPGKYDLDLYRGDTYGWQFVVWSDAERTIPADLTGFTAKAEVYPNPIPAGATGMQLDCSISTNVITVKVAIGDWAGWTAAAGSWDLQLSDADTVITLVAGAVKVTGDVTESGRVMSFT